MILYPTETIYGIGVNPFDSAAMAELFALKGRESQKVSAWLVRNLDDMREFAVLSATAEQIADHFLPGAVTLVLPAKTSVPNYLCGPAGTIGLRISGDPCAQALIKRFYKEHNAPLTCTSANVSGMATERTPEKIIKQFVDHRPGFAGFSEVIDGGERSGSSSTVVRVVGDEITVLREGSLTEKQIRAVL